MVILSVKEYGYRYYVVSSCGDLLSCRIKNEKFMIDKKTIIWPSTLEEAYKARDPHYLVCFRDECPLHDSCLRYACGEYVDTRYYFVEAVNPKFPKVATSECPVYRKNETLMMKTGLTKFFEQMTGKQERAIRAHLISHYNRKVYYWLRNGVKPITPEDQQLIEDVCRLHGYNGPFVYDAEHKEWVW
jgi:hypothetical protein